MRRLRTRRLRTRRLQRKNETFAKIERDVCKDRTRRLRSKNEAFAKQERGICKARTRRLRSNNEAFKNETFKNETFAKKEQDVYEDRTRRLREFKVESGSCQSCREHIILSSLLDINKLTTQHNPDDPDDAVCSSSNLKENLNLTTTSS
ncbi:hypothetical protein JOB18_000183 [Solea senegalensis]|uniref:Uncharacterized protein n=1 Tax=Solea senegalensis TaxID=28829 RepID=A0AAV6QTK2_SOLSE|nr:hypothetical protein JOB18_000183 [Solea senegalensis]